MFVTSVGFVGVARQGEVGLGLTEAVGEHGAPFAWALHLSAAAEGAW